MRMWIIFLAVLSSVSWGQCESQGSGSLWSSGYSFPWSGLGYGGLRVYAADGCTSSAELLRADECVVEQVERHAYIWLEGVPAGVQVEVGGRRFTKKSDPATGATTRYMKFRTVPLKPGSYTSKFKVEYKTQGDQTVTGLKDVTYYAGQEVLVRFANFNFKLTAPSTPQPAEPTHPTEPAEPTQPPEPGPILPPLEDKEPATFRLEMPKEARVYIGNTLASDLKKDSVLTPLLERNKRYYFIIRAEFPGADGEKVEISKKVQFRAGDQIVISPKTFSNDLLVPVNSSIETDSK